MNYNKNSKDFDKSYENLKIGFEYNQKDSYLLENDNTIEEKLIKEPLLNIANEEKNKRIKYKSTNVRKNYYRVNINSKENPDYTNKISTSLYTWYNCFPKILIEQFKKTANIYFLIIALMQSINEISNSGTKPVILMPLAIVIFINGCKIFFEDQKRKASDEEENNKTCILYSKENGKFENIKWKNIKVGNILKIHENEEFPADLILLNSSDINGICYIETKNLDGETNLKLKKSKIEISKFFEEENKISDFSNFIVLCNHPDNNIHEFQGFVKLNLNSYLNLDNNNFLPYKTNLKKKKLEPEDKDISINNESFLLRGCSLKLTKFVYGVVVYTGSKTKIMNNSPTSRLKTSRVEELMNFQIIIIFLFQLLLALIGSISYLILKNTQIDTLSNYIFIDNGNISTFSNILGNLIARIGTWILIFTNFVPISLLVTMEIVKYIQAIFISWDINMYDEESENFAKVQSSTLNEELGQYIFSDKTGTLTKNQMLFKYVAIEDKIYGMKEGKDKESLLKINKIENSFFNSNKFENEEISTTITKNNKYEDKFGEITNVDFNDDCLIDKINRTSWQNKNIDLFFKALSLCHSVIAHNKNGIKLNYFASSLDEKAIVNGCRYLNYIYMNKNSENEITIRINEKDQIFKLLYTMDFDSERKRMSVIVKDYSGKIYLFMKGADDVLRALTTQNNEYLCRNKNQNYLFSTKGLRTLNVAYKEINLDEFDKWEKEYKEAYIYDNIQLKKELVYKIENNLYLLGIVAIEDALQDHVTEVLDVFIKTGIKIWMITGDQKLTAESIAMSCKLITEEFHVNRLSDDIDELRIQDELDEAISFYENKCQVKQSLIIGSNSINIVLNSRSLTQKFVNLSTKMNSVIIYRASPKQKAQIVELIKKNMNNSTTLSIGDGANDVHMITSAHIGVGIVGNEGKQAARASDYSIGQFHYLKRLLLVHGRESYRKNTYIVCYNFYKNCIFVIPQFWYGIFSLFSGQTLYDPWIYQFYNIIFTLLPIVWFGIYDQEEDLDLLGEKETFYFQGIIDKLFHTVRFWKWVFQGAFQGFIIYTIFYFSFSTCEDTGLNQDLWSIGSMVYSAVVLIVNIRLLFSTNSHNIISLVFFALSIFSYYFVLYLMSQYKFENFNNFNMIMFSPRFYLAHLLSVACILIFDNGMVNLLMLIGCIKNTNKMEKPTLEKYYSHIFVNNRSISILNENGIN